MDQFIQVYENVLPENLMDRLIAWSDLPVEEVAPSFSPKEEEKMGDVSWGKGKAQFDTLGRLGRDDLQKYLRFSNLELMREVNDYLTPYFIDYADKFPQCRDSISHEIKLQKTPAGSAGYSVWHAEQGPGFSAFRSTSWLLYLNDVTEGGETEFLYQKLRVSPTRGTLVIWPAGFTHPHRGNPPYSNDKYVITGWSGFDPYDGV